LRNRRTDDCNFFTGEKEAVAGGAGRDTMSGLKLFHWGVRASAPGSTSNDEVRVRMMSLPDFRLKGACLNRLCRDGQAGIARQKREACIRMFSISCGP